jgi:poly(hydroxyalkanoate) depolymerase family esterase
MSGLRESLSALAALRRKFEGLLPAARGKSAATGPNRTDETSKLREVTAFGSNPGNLRMLVRIPEHLASKPALVVALHGCGQSAPDYDHGAGWGTLGNQAGFVVVYPEQQSSNNPKSCFTWFLPGDIARDSGEALSIHQMVQHAIASFGVDRERVFITGLSAGGAMASVMLAAYPDVYAAGAIIAGLPYGRAQNVQEALQTMFTEQSPSGRALGDLVRAASKHQGSWPRISVWHGSADAIVKPSNAEHITGQWANVHGLAATPTRTDFLAGYSRRAWDDVNGTTLIEAYSIPGMAHGVPIASSSGVERLGALGPFFHDIGVSSTHHIARFWNLVPSRADATGDAALRMAPSGDAANESALDVAAKAYSEAGAAQTAATQHGRPVLDPNRVIAAAFKAAGLPVSEPSMASGAHPQSVIDMALKAAGLKR